MPEFDIKGLVGMDRFRDASDEDRQRITFFFDTCSFERAVTSFWKKLWTTYCYDKFRFPVSAFEEILAWKHPSKEEERTRNLCWGALNKMKREHPDIFDRSIVPDKKGEVERRLEFFSTILSKTIAYEYVLTRYDLIMARINSGESIGQVFGEESDKIDEESVVMELWRERIKKLGLNQAQVEKMLPKDYFRRLHFGTVKKTVGIFKEMKEALNKGSYGSMIGVAVKREKEDISKDIRIVGQFLRVRNADVHLVSDDRDMEELVMLDLHLESLVPAA